MVRVSGGVTWEGAEGSPGTKAWFWEGERLGAVEQAERPIKRRRKRVSMTEGCAEVGWGASLQRV